MPPHFQLMVPSKTQWHYFELLIVLLCAEILDLNIYEGVGSTVQYIGALQSGHVTKCKCDYSHALGDNGSAREWEVSAPVSWGLSRSFLCFIHSLQIKHSLK